MTKAISQPARRTAATVAGFMFIFYIATGVANMILSGQTTAGAVGTAAILASMAQHATTVRVSALLSLLICVDAVVLGVALYALTRDEDRDLAMLALAFRVVEGAVAAASAIRALSLLSVATTSTAAAGPDAAAATALGAFLLRQGGWSSLVAATCFAIGSTLFAYLFLRARSIPAVLGWLGLLASLVLVVGLPLQIAGLIKSPLADYMWIPMAVFEVGLALWLLIKGVARPQPRPAPAVPAEYAPVQKGSR